MFRLILVAFVSLAALPAHATCFVEYKAKQDNPLQLHYGISALPGDQCPSGDVIQRQLTERLALGGWTLLNVVAASPSEPTATQKGNAGEFYLRY